jgi:hypothetical protein
VNKFLLALAAYRPQVILLYLVVCSILCLGALWGNPRNHRRLAVTWLVASLSAFVLCRLPIIALNFSLNPDESQMLANAAKFMTDLNTWKSVDTTSSGPINAFVLMWANLLGGSSSFVTARLTQVALLSGAWGMLFAATAGKPLLLRMVVGSLIIFCFAGVSEDIHYAAETVSVALLALGIMVTAHQINAAVGWRTLAISAVALGLVPFAKLQAAPVAAVIGTWQIGYAAVRGSRLQRIKNLAVLIGGASAPALAMLVPLALTEGLRDFWISYIVWAQLYVLPSLSFAQLVQMVALPSSYGFSGPVVELFFIGCLFVCACAVIAWLFRLNRFDPRELQQLVFAAAVLLVSVFVVIRPGKLFPHYLHLLIIPSAFLTASLWGTRAGWWPLAAHGRLLSGYQTAAVVLCAAAFFGTAFSVREVMVVHLPLEVRTATTFFGAGNLFRAGDAARPRLLIWGWMPQWYVYSDAIPATRDILTQNEMMGWAVIDYFRSRLLREVSAEPPDYIIDAVAPGSFFFNNPSQSGLATFPALQQIVDARYTLLSANSEGCPRVFALQSVMRSLQDKYADLKNIRESAHLVAEGKVFSAEHISDHLLFETCVDRWLLPDAQTGFVVVREQWLTD